MGRLLIFALCISVALATFACVAPAEVDDGDPEARAYEAVACLDDTDCAARCGQFAEMASMPVEAPVFTESRCELAAVVAGDPADAEPAPSCVCIEGGDKRSALLVSATGPDSCLLYGRDRSCLYEAKSFPGCDLDRPETSCEATCAEVQRRIEVDALREPQARVRGARCSDTGCRCVLEIGGACYVDDWLDAYDCSASDEAILSDFERHLVANR